MRGGCVGVEYAFVFLTAGLADQQLQRTLPQADLCVEDYFSPVKIDSHVLELKDSPLVVAGAVSARRRPGGGRPALAARLGGCRGNQQQCNQRTPDHSMSPELSRPQ